MRQPSEKQIATWMSGLQPTLDDNADKYLGPKDIARIVEAAFNVIEPRMPRTADKVAAAQGTLAHLKDKHPTMKVLKANLTRLVANWHFIREGMEVPEWDGTATTTDMLFIGTANRQLMLRGLPAHMYVVKLKTGLCAGIITWIALTDAFVQRFLAHEAGVSKVSCSVEDISGMEARAEVTMQTGSLKLLEVTATTGQRAHNKDLAERRADVRKCSNGGSPCNTCQKNIKECPLAVWLPEVKNG